MPRTLRGEVLRVLSELLASSEGLYQRDLGSRKFRAVALFTVPASQSNPHCALVAEPYGYRPALRQQQLEGPGLPRQACLLSVASAFFRNLARKIRDSGVRNAMTWTRTHGR